MNVADGASDLQYYQIIELLGYFHESRLIFFIGQSLNQSNDENMISEQEMRVNLFVFSIDFNSVHCLTCQLVKCFRIKQENSSSICIDVMHSASSVEKDLDEESCIFRRVHLCPSAEYAIINCLIGIVPKIYLVKFTTFKHFNSSLDLVQSKIIIILFILKILF